MKCRLLIWACLVLLPVTCFSAVTTSEDAARAAAGWLIRNDKPFATEVSRFVKDVETFYDDDGTVLYHVASLDPSGFIVLSVDDEVEPIIAFSSDGEYVDDADNPLRALLVRDLAGRIGNVVDRASSGITITAPSNNAAQWAYLMSLVDAGGTEQGLQIQSRILEEKGLSDVRVPPLVKSKWDQSNIDGTSLPCYNLYTPGNYPCGCTATAMAQIMRFYRFPTRALGQQCCENVYLEGQQMRLCTLGGDGYNWDEMPLVPDRNTTDSQRDAIGVLCYDASVMINTCFETVGQEKGGGAKVNDCARALRDNFAFRSAVYTDLEAEGVSTANHRFLNMVIANLNAGHPVILSTPGEGGGHTYIADGYGYEGPTLYYHLNMGGSGAGDMWYNLPNDVEDAHPDLEPVIDKCVYNIFKHGDYEIISGRITNQFGDPVIGMRLELIRGAGGTATEHVCYATTSETGVYGFDWVQAETWDATYRVAPEHRWLVLAPADYWLGSVKHTGKSNDHFTANHRDIDATVTMKELSLDICNQGSGEAWVNGQRVSLPWRGTFPALSKVTVRAEPLGWFDTFHGWKGDVQRTEPEGDFQSIEPEIEIVMDGPKALVPYFRAPRIFRGCGTLVLRPSVGMLQVLCMTLQADAGGLYEVDNWLGFQDGDRVWVEGEIIDGSEFGPDTFCGSGICLEKVIKVTTMRECTQGGADFGQYERPGAGFSPSPIQAGEVFTLVFGGANYGTVDIAAGWRIRYYASLDTNITSGDYLLYECPPADFGIPAGSQLPLTEVFLFPGSVPSGQYYIGWIFDPDNAVPESNENNNAGYIKGTRLTVGGGGGGCNADFCQYEPADEGFYPSSIEAGDTFILDFGVANCGSETIAAGWRIRYYASVNTTITSGDYFLFEGVGEFAVLPGEHVTGREVFTFPSGVPSGQYYVGWIFDPGNLVCESNESNNAGYIKTGRLTVGWVPK